MTIHISSEKQMQQMHRSFLRPLLQVAFSKLTQVTRLVTLGRRNKDQWVKKYNLNYSMDGSHWHSYKENGFAKVKDLLLSNSFPAIIFLLFCSLTFYLLCVLSISPFFLFFACSSYCSNSWSLWVHIFTVVRLGSFTVSFLPAEKLF